MLLVFVIVHDAFQQRELHGTHVAHGLPQLLGHAPLDHVHVHVPFARRQAREQRKVRGLQRQRLVLRPQLEAGDLLHKARRGQQDVVVRHERAGTRSGLLLGVGVGTPAPRRLVLQVVVQLAQGRDGGDDALLTHPPRAQQHVLLPPDLELLVQLVAQHLLGQRVAHLQCDRLAHRLQRVLPVPELDVELNALEHAGRHFGHLRVQEHHRTLVALLGRVVEEVLQASVRGRRDLTRELRREALVEQCVERQRPLEQGTAEDVEVVADVDGERESRLQLVHVLRVRVRRAHQVPQRLLFLLLHRDGEAERQSRQVRRVHVGPHPASLQALVALSHALRNQVVQLRDVHLLLVLVGTGAHQLQADLAKHRGCALLVVLRGCALLRGALGCAAVFGVGVGFSRVGVAGVRRRRPGCLLLVGQSRSRGVGEAGLCEFEKVLLVEGVEGEGELRLRLEGTANRACCVDAEGHKDVLVLAEGLQVRLLFVTLRRRECAELLPCFGQRFGVRGELIGNPPLQECCKPDCGPPVSAQMLHLACDLGLRQRNTEGLEHGHKFCLVDRSRLICVKLLEDPENPCAFRWGKRLLLLLRSLRPLVLQHRPQLCYPLFLLDLLLFQVVQGMAIKSGLLHEDVVGIHPKRSGCVV
eukprot:Rhum_TRINITY_DN18594_c0_g1::Rhum_TRINITY_DN18594_c0_g1_i1::g.167774::m.167774